MRRRVLSLLLALSTVLTLLPVQAFAVDTANPIRDVDEGDWCYDAVPYMWVNGATATAFDPNGTMTRGIFAGMCNLFTSFFGTNFP